MRFLTRRRQTRLAASFGTAAALITAMIVAPIPLIPFGEAAEARCATTTPYAASVLNTPSVVGYWRLGESSGTTACEEVAGRNGVYRYGFTLGQPGLLAAESNTSVQLDGAKGRVQISSPPELGGAAQFTAEAWVRAERLDRDQTILRRNGQYMLRLSGASLLARVWFTSGYTEVSSAPVLTVGTARHVAVTYDGSAIRLYADGREVAQRSVSGTPALGSTRNVLLFGEAGGYDNFRGHLDEVALYQAALPASTIADRVAVASGSTTTTTTPGSTTTTTTTTSTTTTSTTTTTTTTTPPPPGTPAPLCSPRSAYTDAVLGSSARPVAYWRLGEATGTVACESAARRDGTYSGGVSLGAAGAIAGDPDTAVGLNGSTGRVAVPSSDALRLTTGLSMEAWIRPGAVDRSQTILRKNGQYMVRANGAAIMARLWWSASTYTEVTSGPVLTAGAVTHVVVTYNGFAAVIYANGVEVRRAAVSGQPSLASTSNPLLLGEAGGYDWFLGQLDEVAVYGAALPASEVANHAAFRVAGGGGGGGGGGGTTSNLVWAAGDIAGCDTTGDEATAALLDGTVGVVATLGDHVYEDGTAAEFANCYDPSWGRHRSRTRPSVGDHEYRTPGASGYFGYFGAAAGPAGQGYYSYDLPGWHVVVLNSNCSVVPCAPGSAQEQWLRADLASSTQPCLLAYWHHPLFSSGSVHGSLPRSLPFWQALYEAGADVVLNGNEHVYERFAQQNPSGVADPQGIRQFTVGTGGRGNYGFGTPLPTSQVRDASTFGVLRLSLDAGGYTWQFVRVGGGSGDSGSSSCH